MNGQKTTIDRWPWQAAITYTRQRLPGFGPARRQFCGGAILAPTMVVTAAHCVFEIESEPGDFSVITGRTRLNDTRAGSETGIADVFIPLNRNGLPRYFLQPGWDVALLKLDSPVSQQPIRMVGAGDGNLTRPGTRTVHTGWGATDELGIDDVPAGLMKASLNIQPPAICAMIGPIFYGSTDLCIGDSRARAASCFGDSGGPVVVSSTGGYRLAGVTSRGIIGACFSFLPAIDTSLASAPVRGWVSSKVIAETGIDPEGSGGEPLPLPSLCRIPPLEGKPVKQARRLLRKAGCGEPKVNRNIRKVRPKAKLKPPRVRSDSVIPGWLWDTKARYPLEVEVQKHRTKKRPRR